jgi:hypothetical protein
VELPAGIKLPESASRTNAPASPEEKRLQELLKLQFDRRPAAVLETLAKQAAGKAETNEVQRFQADVVTGNWMAVKEFIAKLPETNAPQVYKYLLQTLDKAPSTPTPGAPPEMPGQPGNRPPPQPVLFPQDILALADASPEDLKEEQVELLGKLLTKALSRGNFIDPFLASLEAGTPRLGGKDPKKRDLSVKLLIAANRLSDAGKFLPPLEPALEKKDIAAIDLHARYLTALGKQKVETNSVESARKAWDLTQIILSATNTPAKEREQGLNRTLELMPLLTRETGTNWLKETFRQKPDQGMALLAAAGTQVAQSGSNRDTETRRKNLELQRRVVDALLAVTSGGTNRWDSALNVLALGWMQEAEYSKNRPMQRRPTMYPEFDPYGNQIYFDGMQQNYQDPNQLPAIPIDQLLPTAPADAWLAALEKSVLPRMRILLAELHLKIDEDQKALPYLEAVAADQPKAALSLANDLLRGWARSHDPNSQMPMNRYGPYGMVYYGPGSPYGMNPQGTPLTRAMQVRNIADLSKLLNQLQNLPIPPLDQKVVVSAFSAAHSRAEVFRLEDIEKVFGPIPDMKSDTLAEILQTMRERLAGQWRAPRVQQDAKTKRSDKEIEAEVTRGYELVMGLIQRGLDKVPDDWRMNLVYGAALFDWAEFDYGKKVDLAIYVEKRDRAFKSFERAAALYAAKAPELEDKDQTPQVFQQWFNATLGASDLAYLTRQTEPNTNHLDKIRAALFGLPPEIVDRHVAAFGKGLSDSINTLKPELKPRYLRAGIRIVGDHESANEARKLATYYDDLLQEITLDVRVDGDTTVGHNRPFGLFVALRHTEALGRESGGFGKYLQNQQNSGNFYYNPYGKPPVNYRDDFEKQVREKFAESFEILSVSFHEDKVQARGYGRPGWRETPYAYVTLKAKDGSVDRISPLQLDLDFFDRRGQVVLPVASQVQLIDARPDQAGPRPLKKVEVLQILDERDLAKRTLSLEIKASAHGLLPDLKELLDLDVPGCKVGKVEDKGLVISKMDAEGEEVAPISERNWLVSLALDPAQGSTVSFSFPKARIEGMTLTFKRYIDADLAEVKPEVALAGLTLGPRSFWTWLAPSLGVTIFAIIAAWWWRKRIAPSAVEEAAAYTVPSQLTPFNVLNLLRRIHADQKLALKAEQRQELGEAISELQQYFFDRPGDHKNGQPNLEQIARRWVSSSS